MRLAIAQTHPVRGDITANLAHHLHWVAQAVQLEADAVIFPELSLTGYEPALAAKLAMLPTDACLEPLQRVANRDRITIGVGMPIRYPGGICISLVLWHPQAARQVYTKQYLHSDEVPFFVSGHNSTGVLATAPQVAVAICYELSVSAHVQSAVQQGADIYLASVAKSAAGVSQAHQRLQAIAQQHALTTIMVNCVGPCEEFASAGGSAIWDERGQCLAQLDCTHEGILLLDTETHQVCVLNQSGNAAQL